MDLQWKLLFSPTSRNPATSAYLEEEMRCSVKKRIYTSSKGIGMAMKKVEDSLCVDITRMFYRPFFELGVRRGVVER